MAYGSLGAAIGMMTWMWISMIVVLPGAEVNAETQRKNEGRFVDLLGSFLPSGERGRRRTVGMREFVSWSYRNARTGWNFGLGLRILARPVLSRRCSRPVSTSNITRTTLTPRS